MYAQIHRSRRRYLTREERHIRGVLLQTLVGVLMVAASSGAIFIVTGAWRAL